MSISDSQLLRLLSPIEDTGVFGAKSAFTDDTVTTPLAAPPEDSIEKLVENIEETVKAVSKSEDNVKDEPVVSDNTDDKKNSKTNLNLTELFTDKALTALSNLSPEKLLTMSLKEALAEINLKTITGPWVESQYNNLKQLTGVFEFEKFYHASDFIKEVLSQASYSEITPKSLKVYKAETNKNFNVEIILEAIDETGLSVHELQIAQFANYKHTSIKDYLMDSQYFSDEATTEDKDIPYNYVDGLSVIPVQTFSTDNKKFIKVPLAVLGSWKHSVYGDLDFTQQDFDDMLSNVSSKVIGYEPPLFLGHKQNTPDTVEGHPAEAFLETLAQEEDILYGTFEVVNDETYASVEKGQFRYASGEFLRNYTTKQTGEKVGTALVGCALTNRPFLTGLPRVTVLSEKNHVSTVLNLTEPNTMTTEPIQTPAVTSIDSQELSEFKKTILSEFQSVKEKYSETTDDLKQQLSDAKTAGDSIKQELTDTKQNLADITSERDLLKQKVEEVEKEKKEASVAVKLSELNALVLPVEVREKYSDLIKSGALGENESVILDSLKALSSTTEAAVTTQVGTETATHALNDPTISDPYLSTIERNHKQAERQAEKLSAILS